jgi:DNA-3-methyladenine glycosylase II
MTTRESSRTEGIASELARPFGPSPLTGETLSSGLQHLASRDADLSAILARLGAPPMWDREPGFPTLVHIILEQQVSLASARAAFDRLRTAAAPLTPEAFLTFDDARLKSIGFSRQKTGYARGLAQAMLERRLDLAELAGMPDGEVRRVLLKIKGIGPWSADIYLLMALRRPDVWPAGDLALAVAAQRIKRLPACPSSAELEAMGDAWRPWRAVAARLLWYYYLAGTRDNKTEGSRTG